MQLRAKLELSTAEIGLSVRTTNCLEDKGIFTLGDLLNCTPDFLLSIPNFGEKTLEEVYRVLERHGFYHKSRVPQAKADSVSHDVQAGQGEQRLVVMGNASWGWSHEHQETASPLMAAQMPNPPTVEETATVEIQNEL